MEDSQQAFPTGNPTNGGHEGMELRDWFAGQVINGMTAASWHKNYDMEYISKRAYQQADAMVEARKK